MEASRDIIDIGVNLAHRSFRADRKQVIERAFAAGVRRMVVLDMGLHIGVTGWICDERRGMHLRELVKDIPLDRLMIETDAPFLAPRTMPTKPKDGRNEPAYLTHVLVAVADCLAKPLAAVAEATTKTAREFFRLKD